MFARASLGEGGEDLARFHIDLDQPTPESGIPKSGRLTVHLKDDHLQYAITWVALAAAVMRSTHPGYCVALYASEIQYDSCDKSTRRANHQKSVQPFAQKYFA